MLDVLNEDLITRGEEPVAFEHDCREGICGSCGIMVEWGSAWTAAGDHDLPADAASFQRRPGAVSRTLAFQSFPAD